ncbi:MAG: RluA family pseudouridine synthase [Sandaracinaceae bacterium]
MTPPSPGEIRFVVSPGATATLAAHVRVALTCSWNRARELAATGRVLVNGEAERDAASRPPGGSEIVIRPEAPRQKRAMLSEDRVAHLDADVMVVRKPAGLLSVPWDENDKDTLADQARVLLGRLARRADKGRPKKGRSARDPMVGVVQRLDKDTTGLLVFARNMPAKRHLEEQLRARTVHRRYVALVHGTLTEARRIETLLIQDRGDGLRGSYGVFRRPRPGPPPSDAKPSITHVRPLRQLAGATLVECRLETGRQHQIRIHLAEAGHMLVGEPVYLREHAGEKIAAPRPMLHAAELGFVHPRTEEEVRFREPPPPDFEAVLQRLGL